MMKYQGNQFDDGLSFLNRENKWKINFENSMHLSCKWDILQKTTQVRLIFRTTLFIIKYSPR